MIDPKHKGLKLPAHSAAVEAGRLRWFAKAIGETDPIYTDEAAAKAAGYRSLPMPPTFLFCLEMEKPEPFEYVRLLNAEMGKMLHGEQNFKYYAVSCSGDTLTFESQISDVYSKKEGALDFIVKDTRVTDQNRRHVADLRSVMVVRNA